MLFSIIIPAFNAEKHLNTAINSVISQSYTDYELIIIDDRSDDNTAHICHKHSIENNNIKIISPRDKLGIAASRNLGISSAKGDYIIFLDSDDYLTEGSLEYLSNLVINKNKIDFLICKYMTFRGSGERIVYNNFKEEIINNCSKSKLLTYLQQITKKENGNFGYCWCFITRRSFLSKNNIIFPEIPVYEDKIFVLKLILFSKNIMFCNYITYCYRLWPNSISHNINRADAFISALQCVNEMTEILKNNSTSIKYRNFVFLQIVTTFNYITAEILSFSDDNLLSFDQIIGNIFKNNIFLEKALKNSFIYNLISNLGFYKGLCQYRDNVKHKILKYINTCKHSEIYIFCNNSYSESVYNILSEGEIIVSGIIDNDTSLGVKTQYGVRIIHPNDIKDRKNILIIICKLEYKIFKDIKLQLKLLGIPAKNMYSLDYNI